MIDAISWHNILIQLMQDAIEWCVFLYSEISLYFDHSTFVTYCP